jgi:hypothetical protein
LLRNKKRDSSARPLAVAYARQPGGDGGKKYPPPGFLLFDHDLADIFYCSAIKNGIPMPAPSPSLTRGNRGRRLQKIPAAGDFYYSTPIWRIFFIAPQ